MWNINDLIWLALSPIIIIFSIPAKTLISLECLQALTAIASFSMMVKVFDWMRLFEGTSFYVLLIIQTIKEIKFFMLLVVISMITFGLPMSFLNLHRSSEELIIEDSFPNFIPNMLMNQYFLALGEFDNNNLAVSSHAGLISIFFVMATLMT